MDNRFLYQNLLIALLLFYFLLVTCLLFRIFYTRGSYYSTKRLYNPVSIFQYIALSRQPFFLTINPVFHSLQRLFLISPITFY